MEYLFVVLGFFDDEETMPTQKNFYTLEDAKNEVLIHGGTLHHAIYIDFSVYAGNVIDL